jgi:hypothetical protein
MKNIEKARVIAQTCVLTQSRLTGHIKSPTDTSFVEL